MGHLLTQAHTPPRPPRLMESGPSLWGAAGSRHLHTPPQDSPLPPVLADKHQGLFSLLPDCGHALTQSSVLSPTVSFLTSWERLALECVTQKKASSIAILPVAYEPARPPHDAATAPPGTSLASQVPRAHGEMPARGSASGDLRCGRRFAETALHLLLLCRAQATCL